MMTRTTAALGALLGVSLLVNALAFDRLSKQEPVKPAARPATPAGEARVADGPIPSDPDAKLDRIIQDVAKLRRDVEEIKAAGGGRPDPVERALAAGAPQASPTGVDPSVAEIITEQEVFDAYWRNLRKIQGVRGQLDEASYLKAVLDATTEFLALSEPARSRFVEMAKVIAADAQRLAKQFEEERKAIQWNAQDPKGSREQWDALTAKYQAEVKAAGSRLSSTLDLSQPRQKQFSTNTDRWIRDLTPEGLRFDRGWGGDRGRFGN